MTRVSAISKNRVFIKPNNNIREDEFFYNNSERPVDALAEKHPSLTDNLKSRDASASKKTLMELGTPPPLHRKFH